MNTMAMQNDKNYDPRLVGAMSDRGPARPANEDAYWTPDRTTPTELGALYIVADGVGGQEHGAVASRIVTAVLSDVFYRSRQHGNSAPVALEEAVREANRAVFDEATRRETRMGSTVVVASVEAGQVFVAHVGDARAYLVEARQLRTLTRDDTWVQNQVDAGFMSPEMAEKHEFRNVVTQVLGNQTAVNVHLTPPQPFGPESVLLLCSDGLYGALSPEAMVDLLIRKAAPAAAESLVRAAIEAQATDNITAVVVKGGLTEAPIVAVSQRRQKRGWSLWALLLMGVVLFAAVGAGWGAWRAVRSANANETPTAAAPALLPEETGESRPATAVPTPSPSPSPTVRPTTTATPPPIATATPEPSPTAAQPLACLLGDVYVWPDTAMTAAGCPEAVSNHALFKGDRVLIVSEGSRNLSVPRQCDVFSDFIRVQAETDETIAGWVFLNQIERLEPGQECPVP